MENQKKLNIIKEAEQFLKKQTDIKEYIYEFTIEDTFFDKYMISYLNKETGKQFHIDADYYGNKLRIEYSPKWIPNTVEDNLLSNLSQSNKELIDVSNYTITQMAKVLEKANKIELNKNKGIEKYLKYCKENNINIPKDIKYKDRKIKFDNVNIVKEKILQKLSKIKKYENFEILYILLDKIDPKRSFALATNGNEMIEINIISHKIKKVRNEEYSIENDILGELKTNKEIFYMSMQCHYSIWKWIENYKPQNLFQESALQKYLQYCKEKNITKEVIENGTQRSKIPNAMKHYKQRKRNKCEDAR